jgi:Asp-tRNA(Asn)/Glu-tRNA(Gln) amidotransferase A subunit family amidase
MTHDEYAALDGLGLAALVAKKAVTPGELLDKALARLHAVDPAINAVAHRFEELARTAIAAGLPDGPFRGVPFMTKDLGVMVEGAPLGAGSRAWEGFVAPHDGTLTTRYRRAGLAIFGSTTTPELGLTPTTENRVQGETRNPWNPARIAGGSSGGAAAVVAAGVIPMAQASDGGGSIRTPASCCGLFGMKPSRGRIPMGPLRTEGWNGMSVVHAVTRSVRDSAALMDATCGLEPGARYDAPAPPAGGYLKALDAKPATLRIALWTKTWSGEPIDPECAEAARAAAKLCESLGHHVEEVRPPIDGAALLEAFLPILATSTKKALDDRAAQRGSPIADDELEVLTAIYRKRGESVTGVELQNAIARQEAAAVAIARFMADWDVILTPTQGQPPVKLGVLSLSPPDVRAYGADVAAFGPYTAAANATGQPSMSVPLAWSRDGLPIGVMFTGRYGDEATLFRLAAQLEEAQPWKDRRPPL